MIHLGIWADQDTNYWVMIQNLVRKQLQKKEKSKFPLSMEETQYLNHKWLVNRLTSQCESANADYWYNVTVDEFILSNILSNIDRFWNLSVSLDRKLYFEDTVCTSKTVLWIQM